MTTPREPTTFAQAYAQKGEVMAWLTARGVGIFEANYFLIRLRARDVRKLRAEFKFEDCADEGLDDQALIYIHVATLLPHARSGAQL